MVIVVGVVVAALKFGDILTYFLVLFILCMVRRPTSRFAAYKTLFALITVLTVRGVVSSVGGVSSVSIE